MRRQIPLRRWTPLRRRVGTPRWPGTPPWIGTPRWIGTPPHLVAAGLVGSVLAAAGGYWTAARPAYFLSTPPAVVDLMASQAAPARIAYYAGVLLLVGAWLALGHLLLHQPGEGEFAPDARLLRRAGLLWSAPMLLTVPIGSRDLWAYAAQARVSAAGLNPYRVGPSAIGGVAAGNVTPRWVDTPSPYGPLWTLLARGVDTVLGTHQLGTVLGLRLVSALGLVLLAVTVPALARRFGGSGALATWAVLAGPLTVVHGVGGGHNDLLMVGLTSLALWLAVFMPGPTWRAMVVAGMVVGLASAVKFPALAAVPFLPLLRMAAANPAANPAVINSARAETEGPGWPRDGLRRRLPAVVAEALAAGLGYVVVVGALSWIAGYGLSWLGAVSTSSHGGGPVGTVLLAVALVVIWLLALRWPPVPMLAVAMLTISLASRFSLSWYWLWPLAVGALAAWPGWLVLAFAVVSVNEVLYIRPNGQSLLVRPELTLAVALLLAWLVLDRRWRPAARW